MKKFILGFISCASLFFLVGATNQLLANPNQFPITLNGQNISMEGYNINGSTYFKLRDIGNAIGFNVDFVNNTIVLSTGAAGGQQPSEPVPTPTTPVYDGEYELPVVTENSPLYDMTADGIWMRLIDGEYYVYTPDIETKLRNMGFGDRYRFGTTSFYDRYSNSGKIALLENIPVLDDPYMAGSSNYIPLHYYYSSILPLIKSL